LEALYRQRGYQKFENNKPKKNQTNGRSLSKQSVSMKFFQREEANGMGSISAVGGDADYTTEHQSTEPFSFSTLVTSVEGGGVEWVAYRLEIDKDKIANMGNLANEDFPGTDPANIPRLPGLQRIYATSSSSGSVAMYKSKETQTALLLRYLDQMAHSGWRLDQDVTSAANKAVHGVMSFTQGPRFCMIWVMQDESTGESNVTISSR
jgi:hypothetical protein